MAKEKKEIIEEERDEEGGSLVIESDGDGNQASRVVTRKEEIQLQERKK